MTSACARCPTCGQPVPGVAPVPRAPYNPSALVRIKSGATAFDLGWDQNFYERVCREHGLAPVHMPDGVTPRPNLPPPAVPATPLSAAAAARPEPRAASVPSAGEALIIDRARRELRRNGKSVLLPRAVFDVFEVLARLPPTWTVSGDQMATRTGTSKPTIKAYMSTLRTTLRPLGLDIPRRWRGDDRGYCLQDAVTEQRVPLAKEPAS